MTAVSAILAAEGALVTNIAVSTTGYCPTSDNWGAYSQVWDLRIVSGTPTGCPLPPMDDAFTPCWQSQAATYLESGGSLYMTGEFNAFNSKDQGISDFLITIGAVSAGYTDCPGPNGNGEDITSAYWPCNIPGQSGPTSFLGLAVGGIPIPYLNGFNFVGDPVVGDWNDGVNRSAVSGWRGSLAQMANLTGNVGNLVTVWDSTYLTQPLFSGAAQTVNTGFVQSIYCFLGGGPCATITPIVGSTATFTPTLTFTPTITLTPFPTSTPTSSFTPTVIPTATGTFTITPTFTSTATPPPTATFTPVCQIHVWPDPYSIQYAYDHALRISCLPANAQVFIYTVSGEWVNTVGQSGDPTEWVGAKNHRGVSVSPGIYFYVIRNGQTILQRGQFLITP